MAYEVYLDDMLLPIPPQKIPIKYPGQNKTANLISGEEINMLRPTGLAEISLDIVFPQMDYPAAVWDGSVDAFSNSIRVHISALRKKLKAELNYDPITNKVGEGYRIGGERK